jgi:hypothetical protein
MFIARSSFALISSLLWFGCSGVEPGAQDEAAGATLAPEEAQALCVSSFQRQRDCSDTFLPALVDLRVRLDVPAGIAEADRTEGRAQLLATAQEEWRSDSTDQAIAERCAGMVQQGAGAAMGGPMRSCLGASSCGEFVPCQLEIIEAHLRR